MRFCSRGCRCSSRCPWCRCDRGWGCRVCCCWRWRGRLRVDVCCNCAWSSLWWKRWQAGGGSRRRVERGLNHWRSTVRFFCVRSVCVGNRFIVIAQCFVERLLGGALVVVVVMIHLFLFLLRCGRWERLAVFSPCTLFLSQQVEFLPAAFHRAPAVPRCRSRGCEGSACRKGQRQGTVSNPLLLLQQSVCCSDPAAD